MASLIENLIDVLEKESTEYEILTELSKEKTSFIVKGDLVNLEKITDDEQDIVGRINRLEKVRMELFADISNVLNKNKDTLKLNDLVEMLSARPLEQEQLRKVRERLSKAAGEMQQVNERNRELIAHSLELVQFDLNLIRATKMAPQTADYNKGAYNSGNIMGAGSGGFDAKQ